MPAMVRYTTYASPELQDKPIMTYENLFINGNGKFKVGTVESIDDDAKNVVLKGGERVRYDALILATGSQWEGNLAFPDAREVWDGWLEGVRKRIEDSKSIVLVGGGAIGVETAGEIKDAYPDKKVTIVHGNSHLMNKAYPLRFRVAVEKSVRKRGVELVLGDFVDTIPEAGSTQITTRSGKKIQADYGLLTRGPKPNTSLLSNFPTKPLTPTGFVKVKPTLQLVSHPLIFATGDIIDWDEQKQAGKVYGHGDVVVANTIALLEGKEAKSAYKGASEMIIVSNGKDGGVAYFGFLWGLLFGDWVSKTVKSKELLISYGRKAMGLE